jgi:hypothetical protein
VNQEEQKVEETNEVGIKVKLMNNKERHDQKPRMKND